MKLNQSIPTMLFNLDQKTITMELERSIRSVNNNKARASGAMGKSTPVQNPNQGFATLLVMIAVLTIIILFCCFSAPGIRGLCRKYIFRSCRYDDPAVDNVYTRGYYSQTDLTGVITSPPKSQELARQSQTAQPQQ